MKIKNVVNVTGGNTKISIIGFSGNSSILNASGQCDEYIELWNGIIDDIDFEHVPYGDYEVAHLTVINNEDTLLLYFEYPELTKKQMDWIDRKLHGCPYSIDWIYMLYIKYRNYKYVKDILMMDKSKVYEEVRYTVL